MDLPSDASFEFVQSRIALSIPAQTQPDGLHIFQQEAPMAARQASTLVDQTHCCPATPTPCNAEVRLGFSAWVPKPVNGSRFDLNTVISLELAGLMNKLRIFFLEIVMLDPGGPRFCSSHNVSWPSVS